jgi:hypothetical protein
MDEWKVDLDEFDLFDFEHFGKMASVVIVRVKCNNGEGRSERQVTSCKW